MITIVPVESQSNNRYHKYWDYHAFVKEAI